MPKQPTIGAHLDRNLRAKHLPACLPKKVTMNAVVPACEQGHRGNRNLRSRGCGVAGLAVRLVKLAEPALLTSRLP